MAARGAHGFQFLPLGMMLPAMEHPMSDADVAETAAHSRAAAGDAAAGGESPVSSKQTFHCAEQDHEESQDDLSEDERKDHFLLTLDGREDTHIHMGLDGREKESFDMKEEEKLIHDSHFNNTVMAMAVKSKKTISNGCSLAIAVQVKNFVNTLKPTPTNPRKRKVQEEGDEGDIKLRGRGISAW